MVLVVCRRGIDSIPATLVRTLKRPLWSWRSVRMLCQCLPSMHHVQALRGAGLDAYNVAGGLDAYRAQVDGTFPTY